MNNICKESPCKHMIFIGPLLPQLINKQHEFIMVYMTINNSHKYKGFLHYNLHFRMAGGGGGGGGKKPFV